MVVLDYCKRISMRLYIMADRKNEERMPANLLHCMLGKSYITHSRVFPVCNPSPRAFPYRFLWERFCLRLLLENVMNGTPSSGGIST